MHFLTCYFILELIIRYLESLLNCPYMKFLLLKHCRINPRTQHATDRLQNVQSFHTDPQTTSESPDSSRGQFSIRLQLNYEIQSRKSHIIKAISLGLRWGVYVTGCAHCPHHTAYNTTTWALTIGGASGLQQFVKIVIIVIFSPWSTIAHGVTPLPPLPE